MTGRWSSGPGGVPFEFDADVTESIPNQVFAWRSVEGSIVGHAGMVHFESMPDGRTRLHIRMPPTHLEAGSGTGSPRLSASIRRAASMRISLA